MWFLLGLLVIALVGHGLWVAARAAIRLALRVFARDEPRAIEAAMCPRCGEAWGRESGVRSCPACGWPGRVAGDDRARARAAVGLLLQRLDRYRKAGLLSIDEGERLARVLIAERGRTHARSAGEAFAPPPPAASPIARPAVPRPEPGPGPVTDDVFEELEVAPAPRPDLAARARAYRDAKEKGPTDPDVMELPEPEPKNRPGVGGLLAAFMEQRNIRWGELVGGLLIVGCSLALVVGYWARIAERPMLRFGLANGAVAAFFAVGFYAERRWKLPTTAHGLLVIAALLVPLSLLAIVSAGEEVAVGPWLLGGELVALGVFAVLIGRSGRSLGSAAPWETAAGVVVPSAAILMAGRWPATGGEAPLAAIGVVALLAHGGATVRAMLGLGHGTELDEEAADDLIRTLGLTAFASAVASWAVLDRAGTSAASLRQLAVLAPLAGSPALAAGLFVWRRAAESLLGHRVVGGTIAAAGTLLMLAGVALAWPDPAGIAAIAALDGAVLLAIALTFRLPSALALSGGCVSLAALVAFQVVGGPLRWSGVEGAELAESLTSARSGATLVPIVLLFELMTVAGLRMGRRPEARALGLVSLLAGLAAMGLVAWHGLGVTGDPAGVTFVAATLAASCLVGAAVTARRPLFDAGGDGVPAETRVLAWTGSALMLAALVQGFAFRLAGPWGLTMPWSSALLGHATIAASLAAMAFGRRSAGEAHLLRAIGHVLIRSAFATSMIAAILLAWRVPTADPGDLAIHVLWLSGAWLALAGMVASRRVFSAGQAAMAGAVAFGVAAWLEGRPWFGSSGIHWLDPRVFQAEGIALALFGLAWIGVRIGARALAEARPKADRVDAARRLMEPPWPTVDRLTTWLAVSALLALAVYGAIPGAAQELSPRGFAAGLAAPTVDGPVADRLVPPASAFEVPGIPHRPALGSGSWLLLGVVVLTLLAGQWERTRRCDLLGAMLAAAMAVPLLAGRWEADVAVASALRWGGALGLLALSVPIWARGRLAVVAGRIGWRVDPDRLGGLGSDAIVLVVAIAAAPLMAMAAYAAGAGLQAHPIDPGMENLWRASAVLFVVLAACGAGALAFAKGDSARSGASRASGGLLIALGALALVVVTASVVGSGLAGDPILGPEPGSFFDRIGLAGSYAPPILLVVLTLVGFAIRDRSPGFALAGGLLLGFGATVGYLLSGAVPAGPLDAMAAIRLAQLNAIVGSSYAIAWMGAMEVGRRRRGHEGPRTAGPALTVQVALPIALVGLVLIGGVFGLLASPWPSGERGAIAGPWGWAAFGLVVAAAVALSRRSGGTRSDPLIAPGVLAAAAMGAFGTAGRDSGGWTSYHAMLVGQAIAAGFLLLLAWNRRGLRRADPSGAGGSAVTWWSAIALAVVVLFSLRAYGTDPVDPLWWTVGGLLASVLLASALAGWSAGRGFLYVSGVLLNLAATLWWFDGPGDPIGALLDNVLVVNVIALAVPVPAWLWLELRAIRPARAPGVRRGLTPFHRAAAWGALGTLVLMVLAWLFGDAAGGWEGPGGVAGGVATIAALAVALAAGFWDDRSRSEVAGLYVLGLCACGWAVAGFDLPTAMLGWVGAVILAAYAVVAGTLWGARGGLRRLGDRLGGPRSTDGDDPDAGLGWLVPANIGLSAAVVALAFGVVLTDPGILPRFSAAKAALATTLATGLLARGERWSRLRVTALGFGAAGAVAWGWAWIVPDSPTSTLDRVASALVTLLATSGFYGVGLVKLAPGATRWARASRRLLPALLGLAGVALLGVLLGELSAAAAGEVVGISGPALVAVAATLLGAAVAGLVAAVVPGRDPLGLPERRRTLYVYAAEALLALLALHVRLTMPWLFTGFFARYWPLIVLGLAFLGVGLAELFRRQGRLVLAEPLERTGALLPLLPLLGASWLEPTPGQDTLFFVLAGGLYATLALMRSSTGFGTLAALAFNAGLWTVLGRREGFGLMDHPQFWIVPPALCVLAGAFLNRDRLDAARSAAMRHVAASAVYLSSTADLVLNGVAEDPWLPLVLGGLSLLGIFAGIAMRVRGFLLLGIAFLGLSVFAMIWYAAVDLRQTWIWAASGIVVGILILTAFAVFEKRRREIMGLVGRLRDWEP